MVQQQDDKGKKVTDPVNFLRKRGLSPDVAQYVNTLMRVRQEMKLLSQMSKVPEVVSSIEDMIEYIEMEVKFLRNINDT